MSAQSVPDLLLPASVLSSQAGFVCEELHHTRWMIQYTLGFCSEETHHWTQSRPTSDVSVMK